MLGELDKVIGNRRGWGNCVLTADCVRGLDKVLGKGREWGNCVLTADCVRGIG